MLEKVCRALACAPLGICAPAQACESGNGWSESLERTLEALEKKLHKVGCGGGRGGRAGEGFRRGPGWGAAQRCNVHGAGTSLLGTSITHGNRWLGSSQMGAHGGARVSSSVASSVCTHGMTMLPSPDWHTCVAPTLAPGC